jgi:hypothetical protein
VSAPVLCTVSVVIMFYIESHWFNQNTWKRIVCCLLSGSGINAFRMASSNSSPAEKSCACACIAFLAGIFSWYADIRPPTHSSALDGGEWSASRPGRAFPPGKRSPVPTAQEAGWAPEPVCRQRLEVKSYASAGDRTPIARVSSP